MIVSDPRVKVCSSGEEAELLIRHTWTSKCIRDGSGGEQWNATQRTKMLGLIRTRPRYAA